MPTFWAFNSLSIGFLTESKEFKELKGGATASEMKIVLELNRELSRELIDAIFDHDGLAVWKQTWWHVLWEADSWDQGRS